VSEGNIKVWDLEYDECIKNINEHSSPVVYMAQTSAEQITTVGQAFEFKRWNYITGAVYESEALPLDSGDDKQSIICCDICKDLAFVALTTNMIAVFSTVDNRLLFSFPSYNGKFYIQSFCF